MDLPSVVNVGASACTDSSTSGLALPPLAETIQTRPPRELCATRVTNAIRFPPSTQVGSLTSEFGRPVIDSSRIAAESTSSKKIPLRQRLFDESGGMACTNATLCPSGDHAALPSYPSGFDN